MFKKLSALLTTLGLALSMLVMAGSPVSAVDDAPAAAGSDTTPEATPSTTPAPNTEGSDTTSEATPSTSPEPTTEHLDPAPKTTRSAAPAPAAEGLATEDLYTTPNISSFTVSRGTFYPRVRDGFLDYVDFELSSDPVEQLSDDWDTSQTWNITVRNSAGAVVRRANGFDPDWGDWWTWGGYDQRTGKPAALGTYTATLTVTNQEGDTDTATRTVKIATYTTIKRITQTRTGVQTGSRWRRGDCRVTRDGWGDGPSSLYLDCWGGRTGVRYGFGFPRTAKNVTWSVAGSHGFGWNGRIIKTGKRNTPTHFNVNVTVTGWEAYSIRRAKVSYTAPVRR